VIKAIAEALIIVNGRIGWMVLNVIDKDRMHHAETAVEQEEEISELNVLFTIFQIRNNAMQVGKWNEDHEDHLNILGNILANEHDWETEEVERYLYEVIATGPDLAKE
jgi:hypothetical protein